VSLFLDPGGRPGLPGWNGRPRTRDWDADDPGDDDPCDDCSGDDDSSKRTRLTTIFGSSLVRFDKIPPYVRDHESRTEILVGPIQRFLLAPLGGT
jgi:hypothetical protein